MIITSILSYVKKFRSKYPGDIVICCDHSSWRKTYYPHYKFLRRASRENSDTDWKEIFRIIDKVKTEIQEYLPWKVVHVHGAEGDDVIGVLALSTTELGQCEPVMIIAADHDYKQLHKHSNIKQYSTITKKMVKEKDPVMWLFEASVRGQGKDGIPNIFTDGDFFVQKSEGKASRQKVISKKKFQEIWKNRKNLESFLTTTQYASYCRNSTLMDFEKIPKEVSDTIWAEYQKQEDTPFSKVLPYLMQNRMRMLIKNIEDFK